MSEFYTIMMGKQFFLVDGTLNAPSWKLFTNHRFPLYLRKSFLEVYEDYNKMKEYYQKKGLETSAMSIYYFTEEDTFKILCGV